LKALCSRGRWAAAALVGIAASVLVAGPAFAHTEIEISPARAGAANAVMSVNAEAESRSAGITSLRVFPPSGIAPTDITAVKVPTGWKLSTQPDSFTVAGPKLPVGTNAEFQVRIGQLPNAQSLTFKVLQTYSDGRVDRWIGDPASDNPAPVVKLAAAPPAATTTAAAAPSTTAPAQPSSSPAGVPAAQPASHDSDNTWIWVALALLILVAAAGSWVWIARRRHSNGTPS
jgi:uncharacterized protein YcnI